MTKGRRSPEQTSSSWWLVVVLCLSMRLWRSKKMEREISAAYPLNKLDDAPVKEDLGISIPALVTSMVGGVDGDGICLDLMRSGACLSCRFVAGAQDLEISRSSRGEFKLVDLQG
jgi:hypothetical protein